MKNLLKLREAGAVTRYHTVRTLRQQTVAEHSWGVAQLVLYLYPIASAELLKAALNHDLPELHTGDLPSPIKWANGNLKALLGELEDAFHEEHYTGYTLDTYELSILKFADMAELVLWCLEEYQMGNEFAAPLINQGMDYLSGITHKGGPTEALYHLLQQECLRVRAGGFYGTM